MILIINLINIIQINKVYKADNGDLFVIKKNDYKAHSKEEIEDLLNRAKKMYKEGNYEEAADKYIEMTYTLIDFYMGENKKNVRER